MDEQFIQELRQKDAEWKCLEESKSSKFIAYPTHQDVLLGRGRPYHVFPGNKRLGDMVDLYRDRYKQMTERLEKTIISMEVVQRIQDSGGRFLQRKVDGWEVADNLVAREKISQAMRLKSRQRPEPRLEKESPNLEPSVPKRMRYSDCLSEDFD
jgi:hypothetical protein